MGIEWQVIGQQANLVIEQQLDALTLDADNRLLLAPPKIAMVNEECIGSRVDCSFDKCPACGYSADYFFNRRLAFHLQPVRSIVFKLLCAKKRTDCRLQLCKAYRHGPVLW